METGIFFIRGMLLNWRFGFSDWFSLNPNNLNEGQCAVEEFGAPFPETQYIVCVAARVYCIQRGT